VEEVLVVVTSMIQSSLNYFSFPNIQEVLIPVIYLATRQELLLKEVVLGGVLQHLVLFDGYAISIQKHHGLLNRIQDHRRLEESIGIG